MFNIELFLCRKAELQIEELSYNLKSVNSKREELEQTIKDQDVVSDSLLLVFGHGLYRFLVCDVSCNLVKEYTPVHFLIIFKAKISPSVKK